MSTILQFSIQKIWSPFSFKLFQFNAWSAHHFSLARTLSVPIYAKFYHRWAAFSLRNMPCMCSYSKMHKYNKRSQTVLNRYDVRRKCGIIMLLCPLESTVRCDNTSCQLITPMRYSDGGTGGGHIIQHSNVITWIVTILHSFFRCHEPRHTVVMVNPIGLLLVHFMPFSLFSCFLFYLTTLWGIKKHQNVFIITSAILDRFW